MANESDSGGIGLLGVVIGAVIVIALAYFLVGDRLAMRAPSGDVNVRVETPKAPAPAPSAPRPN
jgi:hypothetical protein